MTTDTREAGHTCPTCAKGDAPVVANAGVSRERNELREVAEKATPGPWRAGREDMATIVDGVESKWVYAGQSTYVAVASGLTVEDWSEVMANARFIALSREALPRLLDEIERLEREAANRTTGCPSCACQRCYEKYGRDRDV